MSQRELQFAVRTLRTLPSAQQAQAVDFLRALTARRAGIRRTPRRRQGALRRIGGALVFTGAIGAPDTDWLEVVREERLAELAGLTSP